MSGGNLHLSWVCCMDAPTRTTLSILQKASLTSYASDCGRPPGHHQSNWPHLNQCSHLSCACFIQLSIKLNSTKLQWLKWHGMGVTNQDLIATEYHSDALLSTWPPCRIKYWPLTTTFTYFSGIACWTILTKREWQILSKSHHCPSFRTGSPVTALLGVFLQCTQSMQLSTLVRCVISFTAYPSPTTPSKFKLG